MIANMVFRSKRLTETQLKNVDSRKQTDITVLDLRKGFDKVRYLLLNIKLDYYCI